MTTTREGTPAHRHHRFALIAMLGVAGLATACSNNGTGGGGGNAASTSTTRSIGTTTSTGSNGSVATTSVPGATPALTSALTSAYQSETAALATYRNVISTLGSIAPFSNIVRAEQQHVSTVSALFARYGIALPAPGTGQSSPSTRTAACQLGVTAEQQTISLYRTLVPSVAAYPDVTAAFKNLLAASQDDHLPAFQHCA